MKIRSNFVANSSSASYVIGIAKVEDKEKFDKWSYDKNLSMLKFPDGVDHYSTNIRNDGYRVYIESFNDDFVQISNSELKDGDLVVGFYLYEEPGDGYYCNEEDGWFEMNYDDVDFDDLFSQNEMEMMEEFQNKDISGLGFVDISSGSGRNG